MAKFQRSSCRCRVVGAMALICTAFYVFSGRAAPDGSTQRAAVVATATDQPPQAQPGKPKLRLFSLTDMSHRSPCKSITPVMQKFRADLDPIEGRALRELAASRGAEATLVMLSYRRPENLRVIVDTLLASGVFARAIVWNNDANLELRPECLARPELASRVSVVNSRVNSFTQARFAACAAAATPVCYSQDDDWDPSYYLYALYRIFLRDPQALVVATNELAYATHSQRWSRWNSTYGVHSQHAWLGTGSFFRREDAIRHMVLTSAYLEPDEALHTDVTFSIWRNEVPTITQAPLASFGSVAFAAGDSDVTKRTLEAVSISALDFVFLSQQQKHQQEQEQQRQSSLPFLSFDERRTPAWAELREKYNPRAICSDGRGCVFLTDAGLMFGTPLYLPRAARKFWNSHNHYDAVDSDEDSVWIPAALCEDAITASGDLDPELARSLCRLPAGSFFGVDALRPAKTFRVIFEHTLSLHMSLRFEVSADGHTWQLAKFERLCKPMVGARTTCTYVLEEPQAAVRFVALSEMEPFRVNDIRPIEA